MRIVVANDASGFGGGVDTYLDAVMRSLAERSHAIAFAAPLQHRLDVLPPGVVDLTRGNASETLAQVRAWRSDVVFSHNMQDLAFERSLIDNAPAVKFMHGYFGTCASGQKSVFFPTAKPCDRVLGPACIAAYVPRHCGALSLTQLSVGYRWARAQNAMLSDYRYIVVASAHMAREYQRHGVPSARIIIDPLFATGEQIHPPADHAEPFTAVFLGRMTKLKGGDLLLHAAARIRREGGPHFRLVMAGDGPSREAWMKLAQRLAVDAEFPGWVDATERNSILRTASIMVVPSVWPEPFGLTGLEAAGHGVPSLAFGVGGITQWLIDGVNGLVASGTPPTAAALASALRRLIDDRPLLDKLREGARRSATEWTLARHVDLLEKTFERARIAPADHRSSSIGAP